MLAQKINFNRPLMTRQVLFALALMAQGAHADDVVKSVNPDAPAALDANAIVQAVIVSGSKVAHTAPVQASLKATEPQSVITAGFIEQAIAPSADFIAVARIAPSVGAGVSANGEGLGESKVSLRGFQDGEYNMSYDGIPFGDTNDPTHHSTSYFPARIIGGMVIERGPGNASNLGQATFGGSINLFSKELSDSARFTPYATFGSWNTRMLGAEYDSGSVAALGDAALMLNYSHLSSDGYLSFNGVKEDNIQFKLEKTIGDTVLTAFSTYNKIRSYAPDKAGVTLDQVALYGKNFSLNNDPASQNYVGYNFADKSTDFDYLRVQSKLANGWAFDNTLYSYAYTNNTSSGSDATGGTANGSKAGPTGNKDVPGYTKLNAYRVVGDIAKATLQTTAGLLRGGVWFEHAHSTRNTLDVDWTLNLPNPVEKTAPKTVKYDQNSGWNQVEPFVEFEWAARDNLTVTPGLKYVSFKRSVDAVVNQDTRIATVADQTYKATLPFLTGNLRIDPQWAAYGQLARGFLVPPLSMLYVNNPSASNPAPQTSTNYQLGAVHSSTNLTFDADVYYIDFNNKIASSGAGTDLVYFNLGGAVYKGVEAQATYYVGNGISLHGNGSLNSAKVKSTGLAVAKAPASTAALGLLYKAGPWSGSVIAKLVGEQYGKEGEPAAYKVGAYTTTDLNLAYTFSAPSAALFKRARIQFSLHNLFDRQDAISVVPNSKGVAFDQYAFLPERSALLSLTADF